MAKFKRNRSGTVDQACPDVGQRPLVIGHALLDSLCQGVWTSPEELGKLAIPLILCAGDALTHQSVIRLIHLGRTLNGERQKLAWLMYRLGRMSADTVEMDEFCRAWYNLGFEDSRLMVTALGFTDALFRASKSTGGG